MSEQTNPSNWKAIVRNITSQQTVEVAEVQSLVPGPDDSFSRFAGSEKGAVDALVEGLQIRVDRSKADLAKHEKALEVAKHVQATYSEPS